MKKLVKVFLKASLSFLPAPQHPTHRHEGLHIRWRCGWIKGLCFKKYHRLRALFGGTRVTIGSGFSLQGSLRVRGPGHVILGSHVIVDSRTDLYTNSPEAQIKIGSYSFLNGSRMSCVKKISIDEFAIISDARLADSDFHSLSKHRHERSAEVLSSEIIVRKNVWIGAGAVVLKGVEIGENSVIGFASVVTKSLPANSVGVGNPCRVVAEVPD